MNERLSQKHHSAHLECSILSRSSADSGRVQNRPHTTLTGSEDELVRASNGLRHGSTRLKVGVARILPIKELIMSSQRRVAACN